MKKKKISVLGVIIFVILILLEINGIDLNTISNYISQDLEEELLQDDIKVNNIIDNSNLQVYFINVGQADCILIQNENKNMLIDAGNNEDGKKLVKYFKQLGINDFQYVIGTHPHEDHIGGLDDIINEFNIEELFLPNAYTTTSTFEDVLIAMENKNLEFTVPKIGYSFTLGKAKIKVLYVGDDTGDLNDASIVIRLDYGSNSFLFTGDATTKVENKIINKDLKVDVYKVAHHGSISSNSEKFLDKINPTYGIISCEKNNSYGHPHIEVIESLQKRKVELYRTDELGTILVTSNGNKIDVTNFYTDTNG